MKDAADVKSQNKVEYILDRPCRDYYRAGQIAYAESLTADMVIYWSI